MFKNTPFEAIAKSMTESAPEFDMGAAQEAIRTGQDSLKAWADLAQAQAAQAQAAMMESVEAVKGAKDPQAAFEAFKTSSETAVALFQKNLKDAVALSVTQFHDTVDAVQKAHPAGDSLAPIAKGLKAAASTVETTLDTAMEKGVEMAASVSPTAKSKRASK
ncbi:MAG: hypothetical protein CFE44_11275 [Burkholderiales bacterium PBB4]|nr:MAG: hypothetical protein CFE44_11275 [Burkholderiales bacterium PBB4]